MIISSLEKYKKPIFWFGFHIILSLISVITKFLFIFYFYLVIFSSFYILINFKKNVNKFIYLLSYLVSFEVFARILNCSPWIPYEVSKYLTFIFLVCGILINNSKSKYGFFLLILLIPALFYDFSNKVSFENIVFNLLGPINLCFSIWFFSSIKFSEINLNKLLVFLLLPLLSTLFLAIIKSPDFSEATFVLGANDEFTGGFGSNQVSTVFGVGLLLIFFIILNNSTFSGYIYIDIIILVLFLAMGLLSFSRGGILGSFISLILAIILFLQNKSSHIYKSIIRYKYVLFFTFTIAIISILFVNSITRGSLFLRYQGETSGTLQTGEDISIDKFTTGRFNIFLGEVMLFKENIFGVGVGASQFMRSIRQGEASHTELGRLISEHGILGIIYFLILCILFLKSFYKVYKQQITSYSVVFIFLAIFTSFHAATRTFVTPLFFGLGMIVYKSSNLNRKNILRA